MIGLGVSVLALAAAHAIVAVLSGSVLLVTVPALITAGVLNPLFFSGMCALVILIALAKDADAAIVPSFILGMGPMMGIPAGVGTGIIDLGSWSFCLYQAAATVVLWGSVLALLRIWRKERVVHSARE